MNMKWNWDQSEMRFDRSCQRSLVVLSHLVHVQLLNAHIWHSPPCAVYVQCMCSVCIHQSFVATCMCNSVFGIYLVTELIIIECAASGCCTFAWICCISSCAYKYKTTRYTNTPLPAPTQLGRRVHPARPIFHGCLNSPCPANHSKAGSSSPRKGISVTGWQSVGKALYGSQKPVITLHPYLPWNQVQSKSAGSGLQSTPCYMLWQPHLGLTVQHMIVHCNWSDGKYQHQYNLPHNLNHMLQAASCIWQSRICNQSYIPWYCNQGPMQSINMIVDPNHIDCLYANLKIRLHSSVLWSVPTSRLPQSRVWDAVAINLFLWELITLQHKAHPTDKCQIFKLLVIAWYCVVLHCIPKSEIS